jgi:hypothetical protein
MMGYDMRPQVEIEIDRTRMLWLAVRRALLMIVAAIEKVYGKD